MNYLAHILLSGTNSKMKVGNFIGDFVKGSQYNKFPHEIRKGILLHRKIDEFTDSHPVVIEVVALLKPVFGRYSGIIADMYFDYFLARNFKTFAKESLTIFSIRFYIVVIWNYRYLPKRVKKFIFHFVSTNRLKKYGSLDGLQSSLEIMANYKIPALNPEITLEFLKINHDRLESEFFVFMPDLIAFSKKNQ